MNKQQKESNIAELKESFQRAQAVVLAEYKGLTVAQSNSLRRDLDKNDTGYRVVKNTLAKIAIEGTSYEGLKDDFVGPISVAFAYSDPAATAKALQEFSKANPTLLIKCGSLGGVNLTASDVEALSKLPSREQLLGQLLSVLAGPMRNLVGVLSGVPRKFVQVLQAIEDKKAA